MRLGKVKFCIYIHILWLLSKDPEINYCDIRARMLFMHHMRQSFRRYVYVFTKLGPFLLDMCFMLFKLKHFLLHNKIVFLWRKPPLFNGIFMRKIQITFLIAYKTETVYSLSKCVWCLLWRFIWFSRSNRFSI